MQLAFLETAHGHLRFFHVDLAQEVHVRETLDDFTLSALRDCMVVSADEELE